MPNDFHGAAFYSELVAEDLSEEFINTIEKNFKFDFNKEAQSNCININGSDVIKSILSEYDIKDKNFVKPGIGETTRVLLRRIPWKILINEYYADSDELTHIYRLADEKKVECEISRTPLENYKVCGIIKNLSDV